MVSYNLKQIDKKFLIINKIRLTILALITSILISLSFKILSLYWLICIITLVVTFVTIYAWYIPNYYKSFYYILGDNYLIISYGIIFNKRIFLNLDLITKTTLSKTPLQKLFKINTLTLSCPGVKTFIVCLDKKSTLEILHNINYNVNDNDI